jgi:hypothetical protein
MAVTEHCRIVGKLTLADLIAWNDFIWTVDTNNIVVDFSRYHHASIFDLVFMAHQMRAVQIKRNIKIEASNHEHMTWAQGMNFFTVSGSDWASSFAPTSGDGFNYIPMTVIDCNGHGSALSRREMNEQIDGQAAMIAKVLLHLGSGAAYDTIQYTFREIIRNIFEHSGAKSFIIAGQYYPKHKNVQIVIADNGQGIPNSLRWNKAFAHLSDKDALNIALMPGVSGNAAALSTAPADIWQNSGYGLYMISRLARNRGLLNIISGKHSVFLRQSENYQESKENAAISNFSGTLIRVGLPIDDENLAPKLKQWAEEGKEIAKDIAGAKMLNASAASLLLRRDFERQTQK